jgi:hypothetical protein
VKEAPRFTPWPLHRPPKERRIKRPLAKDTLAGAVPRQPYLASVPIMRFFIFSLLALAATATHAEQPACLPSTLALSSVPTGTPIPRHIDRPSLFLASNHGMAAYWYCQSPEGQVTYWEIHGTPKAVLAAGGAGLLEMLYIKDRDGALSKLSSTPCNRAEIADPDEQLLCKELLDEVKAQWPKSSVIARRP